MDALSSARLSLRSALPLAVLYVLVIWASYAAGFDEDEIIPIWPAAGILIYAATKPDTFRDKAEVVADGKLVMEGGKPVLYATTLMAKCPSKYEGAQRDKMFEQGK